MVIIAITCQSSLLKNKISNKQTPGK